MQIVYCTISVPLLDELPKFWAKLKAFVGDYRIEPHPLDQWVNNDEIIISFFTDKIEFAEGERRRVVLTAKNKENGEWDFIEIIKA